jgi:hypothetical protein
MYIDYYYRQAYNSEGTESSLPDKRSTRWRWITLIIVLIILAVLSIAGVIIAIYSLVLITNISEATTSASTTVTGMCQFLGFFLIIKTNSRLKI